MRNEWLNPPAEFALLPFWFWNDVLEESELLRQIDDFEQHGVHGFVIHPRVGLPRDCAWMSDRLLGFMHVAIDEAARRGMKVILYDEGMYPSGSSSGQVVARHPHLACRGLARHSASEALPNNATVVAETTSSGKRYRIVDRPVDSYVRGLHYLGEGPAEDEPPAGDILNPATAAAVIELVHEVFAQHFGRHFGRTILGIFTDEPGPLGKCRERGVMAGTTGIVEHVSRLLGYDFRPRLPHLWEEGADADAAREAWNHAIRLRLNETWYKPLSDWCDRNGVALCGHPDRGDEIGAQRFFHIPGQDLVWRWVEPGKPSSTQGHESTQGKCSSSAMLHLGRRRNSNEFAGAYGAQTTFEEVRSLAWWCLVRGVNLLIPHAFYYSVRGPRRDERPPQIGPHTTPWETGEFKSFADACKRLCWVNTDSRHLCHVAILTHADQCPWRAAEVLLKRQVDFNYLDPQTLLERGVVDSHGVVIAGTRYTRIVVDGDDPLPPNVSDKLDPAVRSGLILRWAHSASGPARANDPIPSFDEVESFVAAVASSHDWEMSRPRIYTPAEGIRVRWVEKNDWIYGLIFNEALSASVVTIYMDDVTSSEWLDATSGSARPTSGVENVELKPFELRLFRCKSVRR